MGSHIVKSLSGGLSLFIILFLAKRNSLYFSSSPDGLTSYDSTLPSFHTVFK